MTRDDLKGRLVDCFAALFPRLSRDEVLSVSRDSVPEWDSLASVTLLAMLQQEFHLDVDLTDLEPLTSFGAVLAYLEERISGDGRANAV